MNNVGACDKILLAVLRKSHHIQISIMQSTRRASDLWKENVINGFITILNRDTSNVPNILNPDVTLGLAS